jgi:hypothetical protein
MTPCQDVKPGTRHQQQQQQQAESFEQRCRERLQGSFLVRAAAQLGTSIQVAESSSPVGVGVSSTHLQLTLHMAFPRSACFSAP